MRIVAGKITRSQKGVIYGCEGVGKSTFASKFPNPLYGLGRRNGALGR